MNRFLCHVHSHDWTAQALPWSRQGQEVRVKNNRRTLLHPNQVFFPLQIKFQSVTFFFYQLVDHLDPSIIIIISGTRYIHVYLSVYVCDCTLFLFSFPRVQHLRVLFSAHFGWGESMGHSSANHRIRGNVNLISWVCSPSLSLAVTHSHSLAPFCSHFNSLASSSFILSSLSLKQLTSTLLHV